MFKLPFAAVFPPRQVAFYPQSGYGWTVPVANQAEWAVALEWGDVSMPACRTLL